MGLLSASSPSSLYLYMSTSLHAAATEIIYTMIYHTSYKDPLIIYKSQIGKCDGAVYHWFIIFEAAYQMARWQVHRAVKQ